MGTTGRSRSEEGRTPAPADAESGASPDGGVQTRQDPATKETYPGRGGRIAPEEQFGEPGGATESYTLDYSPYTVTRSISSLGSERALDLTVASSATVGAGQVSGEIQGRVAKSDWSNFDQSNDFSYLQTATSWTRNPYVAIYVNGNQAWGAIAR